MGTAEHLADYAVEATTNGESRIRIIQGRYSRFSAKKNYL